MVTKSSLQLGSLLMGSLLLLVVTGPLQNLFTGVEHSLREALPSPDSAEDLPTKTGKCSVGFEVTESSIFNLIANERALESRGRVITMPSLTTYAQILANESEELGYIPQTSTFGTYFEWAKKANTSYEERMYDQAGGWVAAANQGTPCDVFASLSNTPARRDYLVGSDTEAIGVGVSSNVVIVVVARFAPKQETVYIPAPTLRPLPTIALPKRTTCKYNDILNQMECVES